MMAIPMLFDLTELLPNGNSLADENVEQYLERI